MSTYLYRTFGSGGNLKKWTFSFWMKVAFNEDNNQHVFSVTGDGSNDEGLFRYRHTDNGAFEFSQADNSTIGSLTTSAMYRDPASWYHVVCVWDSNNATGDDRMIMYVNGSRITEFSSTTTPTQNIDSIINTSGWTHGIGSAVYNDGWTSGNKNPFGGTLAHFHFCDGYAYAASDFGQTDATTGGWKPKTSPSVSYGTTGFFLEFGDNADLGNDTSGLDNDWSVENTATRWRVTDTPSNNFASVNRISGGNTCRFSGANSNAVIVPDGKGCMTANTALYTGKWYWECKITSAGQNYDNAFSSQKAQFRLDGNLTDNSGNQSASVQGTVTYAEGPWAPILAMNTSDGGAQTNFPFPSSTGEASSALWVKSLSSTADRMILGDVGGAYNIAWHLETLSNGFKFVNDGPGGPTVSLSYTGGTIMDGNWHFIVCNKTGATTMDLWLDGTKVVSGGTVNNRAGVNDQRIGFYGSTGTSRFQGLVSAVNYYNTAMSDADIAKLYNGENFGTGVAQTRLLRDDLDNRSGTDPYRYSYHQPGTIYNAGSNFSSDVTVAGDIVGHYMDLDNHKMYFYKNGTGMSTSGGAMNAGTAANGLTLEQAFDLWYVPIAGSNGNSGSAVYNFGQPPWALSSSNADANGYGSFEYDPTQNSVDYLAICSKNINTNG